MTQNQQAPPESRGLHGGSGLFIMYSETYKEKPNNASKPVRDPHSAKRTGGNLYYQFRKSHFRNLWPTKNNVH